MTNEITWLLGRIIVALVFKIIFSVLLLFILKISIFNYFHFSSTHDGFNIEVFRRSFSAQTYVRNIRTTKKHNYLCMKHTTWDLGILSLHL